jgi:hypothetical protein
LVVAMLVGACLSHGAKNICEAGEILWHTALLYRVTLPAIDSPNG